MSRLISLVLCATAAPVLGNYADDTGYNQLKAELGAAMPAGNGVGVTQVEATGTAGAYLAQAGEGTYAGTGLWAGKTFTTKSGAGTFSDHAFHVGTRLYSINTDASAGEASMAPLINAVDCWNANDWDDVFLAPGITRLAPIVETRAVQNHSWVNDATASNASTIKDLVRRQDFSINRDNYVCCVGLNNTSGTVVPDMFASAYNVISVGLSSGEHSRGGVTSDMDGPGRRKPEIVAPLDYTSFSTAYVSSASALLREKADLINTTNARKAKTIRAVLLAGATKDEFPAWSKTGTDPIDAVYGAGELNIYNSYHILDGGEQPANDTAGHPYMAWDNQSLSANGTADYRLNIPAGMMGVELSAFVVWNRTLTNASAVTFIPTPDALINFDLTLLRDPADGAAAVTLDSSLSTLYNIEHVWKKNLTAGNYRLRVSRGAGIAQDYSIAWRLTVQPHQPVVRMTTGASTLDFTFSGLLADQPYKFQSSPDLLVWTDISSFTPAAPAADRTQSVAKTATPRMFYRLLPLLP